LFNFYPGRLLVRVGSLHARWLGLVRSIEAVQAGVYGSVQGIRASAQAVKT